MAAAGWDRGRPHPWLSSPYAMMRAAWRYLLPPPASDLQMVEVWEICIRARLVVLADAGTTRCHATFKFVKKSFHIIDWCRG